MKKIITVIMMLALASGAYAAEGKSKQSNQQLDWMVSHNRDGQVNLTIGAGLGYGLTVVGGLEVILGNFKVGPVPLQWGAALRGAAGFGGIGAFTGFGWSASPMVTLHWGVDFGDLAKFEWWIGVGPGVFGETGTNKAVPFGFGFFGSSGLVWHFSPTMSLSVQGGYSGNFGAASIGVLFRM